MDLEVSQNGGPLAARKLCGDYEGIMGSECRLTLWDYSEGTLLGTPNRESQEYSRYIIGIYLPGFLYSVILLLHSWGSQHSLFI